MPASQLSVRQPRERVPTVALFAIAAIFAVGVSYAVHGDEDDEEDSALSLQRGQAPISSPPPLGYNAEDREDPSLLSGSITNEQPNIGPEEFQTAIPLFPSPPSPQPVNQTDIQNTPVAPTPFEASFQASQQSTPTRQPRPSPALILDRGVRRAAAPHSAVGTEFEQNEGTSSSTLVLERPNSSPTVLRSGSSIPAVLETTIDTSQPGDVRAMVSSNVYASSGRDVLIPRGSRLIGEYGLATNAKQRRVVVSWSRLVLPDGHQVSFDFSTSDRAGNGGVPGRVRSNTVGRILGSVLQSAFDVLTFRAANAGRDSSVLVAIPTGASGAVQAIVPSSEPARRITVEPGALINVLVEQDIDFAR